MSPAASAQIPSPLTTGLRLYEEATAQMIGFQRLFLIDDNRTDQHQLHDGPMVEGGGWGHRMDGWVDG